MLRQVTLTAWGITQGLTHWSYDERVSVSHGALYKRLKARDEGSTRWKGRSDEEILTAPSRVADKRTLTVWGITQGLTLWSYDSRVNVSQGAIAKRYNNRAEGLKPWAGRTDEEILTIAPYEKIPPVTHGHDRPKKKTTRTLTAWGITQGFTIWARHPNVVIGVGGMSRRYDERQNDPGSVWAETTDEEILTTLKNTLPESRLDSEAAKCSPLRAPITDEEFLEHFKKDCENYGIDWQDCMREARHRDLW